MDSGSIGDMALWAAVVAAGLSSGGALLGVRHHGHGLDAVTSSAGRATLASATVAVAALAWSLLTGNFALAYVADTTTRQCSWPYRLAGMWGGNGGSLLLWAWIILIAGVCATRRQPGARLVAIVTGGGVLAVTAVAANPFARLSIPAIDGGGLTPILRYPAMVYHPPLLYAGHAGLAAPFALALAALARGRLDQTWVAAARRWMLVAWLLLGVGLIAGSRWSYAELGWGGFWAWDPVENGGLLPWLAATAFLHRARNAPRPAGGRCGVGFAGLAALPFCMSLLGATVSRSGAAQSVHAFAQAGAVGGGLLVILAAAVSATVVLMARYGRTTGAPAPPLVLRTRDGALATAVALLLAIALAVLVGTVFPALTQAIASRHIAVGSHYYTVVVTPLAVVAVLLMGFGPSLPRSVGPTEAPALASRPEVGTGTHAGTRAASASEATAATPATVTVTVVSVPEARAGAPTDVRAASAPKGRGPRLGLAAPWLLAASVGTAATVVLAGAMPAAPMALGVGAAMAGVLTVVELRRARGARRVGGLMAHAGIAIMLLGVAGSLLGRHTTQVVRPGSSMGAGGFVLHYREVRTDQGGQWRRARVVLDVSRGGRSVAVLRPALRVFAGQAVALSDVASHSSVVRDLVVAVRQVDPVSKAAELEVTTRPLVALVWWGGLLAAVGGALVSLRALRGR